MAEIVLSAFLSVLFDKLVSPAFVKPTRYMGIDSEMKKWKKSLSEIRDLLEDASQKEITNKYVKDWLNRLQHLAYDIDDILDDLATEAMGRELTKEYGPPTSKVGKLSRTSFTTSFSSVTSRLHDKLNNITTKLQDLEKEKVILGLNVINGRPVSRMRTYEPSLPDACSIVGRQVEKELLSALRLSYHDLSASLKQLFAYCSFFPKDYLFDKEELILLWMAEGFLDKSTSSTSTMEVLGRECFEELLSRSFFQCASNEESLFVMHDLMNDLATFVAGDFFLRLDHGMGNDARKEALERYRHMSFVREEFGTYNKFKTFKRAKSLRTFLAVSIGMKKSWGTFYLSNKILVDLLHELPLLRVLCLSYLEISEVPSSISSLKHLRYLSLAQTRITRLPESVCDLYNLQTLIVFGCKSLIELPKSLLKLQKLRHFDISETPLLKKIPLEIGELKSLQTLSKIIIGVDNGFGIAKLKNFKDLHGKVSIKGLHKVQNAKHAGEANLSEKRLSELELEWSDVFDGSRNETLEKEVLNMLKPGYGNLKNLGIVSYGGIGFPNWVGDSSFDLLTHVSIRGCTNCTSLPPLGQLPSLKKLFVQGMDKVRDVGSDLLGTSRAFPSLEILSFQDMIGWKEWSTNRGAVYATFPFLLELRINNCPNLVEVSLEALPSLRVLEVNRCGHGVLRSLVHLTSSITKLEIRHISAITGHLLGGIIKYLGPVEELSIEYCDEIGYLWESEVEACKILVQLNVLSIRYCMNLVSFAEKEDDNCGSYLTSLRKLDICACTILKHFNCPNSIEMLSISLCDSLTSISFPTGEQKLKSLEIYGCEKLWESELKDGGIEMMLINANMPMLQVLNIKCWPNMKSINELSYFIHLKSLSIRDCQSMESFPYWELPNLTSLKDLTIENCPSMDASFPDWELPNLTSLKDLTIENCPSMDASFPYWELPNLTSLKDLTIENCPSMDASFPRGLWPPNLCELTIGRLKKPISEWCPQNFPISLVSLSLIGGSSDDVSNWSQLSHLLPSSLVELRIEGFGKLKSVTMGLQHLTSLQHLSIKACPEIKQLPEMLFPSLLSLIICACPNLEEMCKRGGSYRRLISHIPKVQIRNNFWS